MGDQPQTDLPIDMRFISKVFFSVYEEFVENPPLYQTSGLLKAEIEAADLIEVVISFNPKDSLSLIEAKIILKDPQGQILRSDIVIRISLEGRIEKIRYVPKQ